MIKANLFRALTIALFLLMLTGVPGSKISLKTKMLRAGQLKLDLAVNARVDPLCVSRLEFAKDKQFSTKLSKFTVGHTAFKKGSITLKLPGKPVDSEQKPLTKLYSRFAVDCSETAEVKTRAALLVSDQESLSEEIPQDGPVIYSSTQTIDLSTSTVKYKSSEDKFFSDLVGKSLTTSLQKQRSTTFSSTLETAALEPTYVNSQAPRITLDLVPKTFDVNQDILLRVNASGKNPMRYDWYYTPASGGSAIKINKALGIEIYSDSLGSSLIIRAALADTRKFNNNLFKVRVYNKHGSVFSSNVPVYVTSSDTSSPTPVPTTTPTNTSTATSVPTMTPTRVPTFTQTATLTATRTSTAMPSITPTTAATRTSVILITATHTATRAPTATSTRTPTASFTSTLSVATATPTVITTGTTSGNLFGNYSFGYIFQGGVHQAYLGSTWTGGTGKGHIDRLFYNFKNDGYGGLPQGSCLQRSIFITDPVEREICANAENTDLMWASNSKTDPAKNLLIKNVTLQNAFRTKNAVGGTTVDGVANDITNGNQLPHTDTFQSYMGSIPGYDDYPEWMVIQDTIIKNSDGGNMIVGDTQWKGIVYQNLDTFCEGPFAADAQKRVDNDFRNYIGSTGYSTAHPCGNQIGAQIWRSAPVWLINVSSGASTIGVINPHGSSPDIAPVVVVGKQQTVTTRIWDSTLNRWGGTISHPNVRYYPYIEDALADGHQRPPYIELSCSGWKNPPAGCTAQKGYLPEAANQTYSLATSVLGTGTLTVNPNKTSYASGERVEITANPASGLSLAYWTGCLSSTNTCTITMDADKRVTATFSDAVKTANLLYGPSPLMSFDGTQEGQTVSIDHTKITNQITISAKIMRQSNSVDYVGVFSDESYSTSKGYYLGDLVAGADRPICFRVNGLAGNSSTVCEPSAVFSDSKFTHYVAEFDGTTKTISLYRDGVLVSQRSHPSSFISINSSSSARLANLVKGQLKEVQVFDAALKGIVPDTGTNSSTPVPTQAATIAATATRTPTATASRTPTALLVSPSATPTILTTATATPTILDTPMLLPRTGWSIHSYSSQETVGEDTPARYAIDGDTASFWHSKWTNAAPHSLAINLGTTQQVIGIRYMPRQDGGTNGLITNYQIHLSDNGTDWTLTASGTWSASISEKQVLFSKTQARYVRLTSTADQFATIAELSIVVPQSSITATATPTAGCIGSASQSCSIANGTGIQTRTCTNGVWSSYGSCAVQFCNSGYIISGNSCVQGVNSSDCTSGSAQSITQYGITWYFDRSYQCGQFANGDYWIVGPATITRITPESLTTPYTKPDGTVVNWTKNGTMVNPKSRPDVAWQVDANYGGNQGFDSSAENAAGYSNSNNVAPSNTGRALYAPAHTSVVSSISTGRFGARSVVDTMAVLTVLPSAAPAGSFRPPYVGTDKTVKWNKSQLNYSILKSLNPVADTPALSTVESYFERPWQTMFEANQVQAISPVGNMPNYGRDMGHRVNDALLSLHLNYTNAQKEKLYVRLVQYGIDVYGAVKNAEEYINNVIRTKKPHLDVFYSANGGLNGGQKAPMVLAGIALNDTDIKELSNGNKGLFHEDKQTFYVPEWLIGADNSYCHPLYPTQCNEPYTPDMLGMPEWTPDKNLISAGSNWDRPYRQINGVTYVGFALGMSLVQGGKEVWNWPAFFDYADRYWSVEQQISAGNWASQSNSAPNAITKFTWNMWKAYRN